MGADKPAEVAARSPKKRRVDSAGSSIAEASARADAPSEDEEDLKHLREALLSQPERAPAPAASAQAGDSDDDSSSSSSSSSSSDDEHELMTTVKSMVSPVVPSEQVVSSGEAPDAPKSSGVDVVPPALAVATDKHADDSSSSSSSSESDVEGELKRASEEEAAIVSETSFLSMKSACLKRDELIDMLLDLPEEDSESAIVRSFVRVVVQQGCILAQVTSLEPSAPYTVTRRNGDPRRLHAQLKCSRGPSSRLIKISSVSNQEVTEDEFKTWRQLTNDSLGVRAEHLLDQCSQKALGIVSASKFNWDENMVKRN